MAEGLDPAEVGSELRHHAEHTESERDRVMTIIEAALLATVALLAAWSGYAAAKWSTESRLTIAEAATIRNQANTTDLEGLDVRIGDALVFNSWFEAHTVGNAEAEAVALRRFRPELRRAFDAWLATAPDTNPDAPPGPQAMPEYRMPLKAEAEQIAARAEALAAKGSEQGTTGDDYVRTTVYLASVLFLVGISSHFRVPVARRGLVVVGAAILTFAVVQLIDLPKPPA